MIRISDWRIRPSTGHALDILDGLRGVAILMVVFFHAIYFNPESSLPVRLLGHLAESGWMGVPLFFVLSGFLISRPFFLKRLEGGTEWFPKDYFRHRAFKIIPPFYVALAIGAVGAYLFTRNPLVWTEAAEQALGLHNFIPQPIEINRAFWSLVVEVHFYLLLPMLFWLTRRISLPRTATVVIGVLLGVPYLTRWLVLSEVSVETFKYRLIVFPNQLDYFAWGVAFAYLYSLRHTVYRSLEKCSALFYLGVILFIGVVLYWAGINLNYDHFQHPTLAVQTILHLWLGAACFFLMFGVFVARNMWTRVLNHTSLMFLGVISYEWFLLHDPPIRWLAAWIGHAHGSLLIYALRTVVPLFVTLLIAAAFYRWFSLPILRYGRKPRSRVNAAVPSGLPVSDKPPIS